MKLGYNTNGLAHHRLVDAIELLADLGYQSIAITLDAGALDPYDDPHTLVRSEFLHRAIDIAEALDAQAVSLWSGRAPLSTLESEGLDRLAEGLRPILAHAERVHIPLAFEPEPGMFIDTLEQFGRLDERIDHPFFQLTVDLGHVHCLEEGDIPALIRAWGARIANIHIEDMVRGVHEHLMFGEGTMDFPPICRALGEIGYAGGVHVELSRHSHAGVEAARAAAAFLMPLLSSRPIPERP
jgi:L-ribulose-5-phosphate 3-epimerase